MSLYKSLIMHGLVNLGNCCSIHLSYGATFRINNLTYTCDLIDHSWSPSGTTAPFHNR